MYKKSLDRDWAKFINNDHRWQGNLGRISESEKVMEPGHFYDRI